MSRYDDNTAAGMALSQEESMYLTPAASPTGPETEEKENYHPAEAEPKLDDDIIKHSFTSNDNESQILPASPPGSERNLALQPQIPGTITASSVASQRSCRTGMETSPTSYTREDNPAAKSGDNAETTQTIPKGLAKVDMEIDRSIRTRSWDFTKKPPSSRTPSAMLQPYAKYVGTQQSGHHTYNVEVTILTVNMDQCDLSGFLKISDLTPEHPVLETFFTGEIVGGPNQRYSFRTMDPAWGTNEKVDLLHWMRFPAWRQFSSIGKRDMSFDYPLNGQEWYQQEHIFMRWKERFLAPDHRKSNLSGASFEGFYYICLNQMEGKISGVYFHSNSEK